MAKGDVQMMGFRRKRPESAKVKARVEQLRPAVAAYVEGVQRLNAGFFELERMRAQAVAVKKAAKTKPKARGK